MQIRKTLTLCETTTADATGRPCPPVTRAAAIAVLENPCAGRDVDDLSVLIEAAGALGERLAAAALALLPKPAVAYGKAALVGVAGDPEHGAALTHPRLGKPMRAAVGGGGALIPSTVKLGVAGATLDVPLGHKDEAWSFDHLDTWSLCVPDAPLPGEIVLVVAYSDGTRPHPRVGSGPGQR